MLFSRLLFLFIVIPLAELILLLQIGARIGPMPTLGLIVLTGLVGASLARQQGLSILRKIQSEMQSGRPPCIRNGGRCHGGCRWHRAFDSWRTN